MSANNTLRVTGLDFDTIRGNLRDFIADKPAFKDYDFNSSAIGTLLDLLAYNTYYNAFHLNMAVNEGFIDSAQLRNSVVSRAKSLGYTPRSARGATASINLKFPNANTTTVTGSLTIPKGQTFTATVNNVPLTFSTTSATIFGANSTDGFSANISITEGTTLVHRFTTSSTNTAFTIPNANVDTRFFDVTVQTSGTNTVYTKADTLFELNGNSTVYFLEESSNNRPRIVFGNGVVGKRPDTGSTVFTEYRVVNAKDGNGANNFTSSGTIAGQSSYTISVIDRATGGLEAEDIEDVRFNAVKDYQTQERAVTSEDYKRIILSNSSDVKTLVVYGGEEANPPVYGRVYIAAAPVTGTVLSDNQKTELTTLLKKFNVQSIEPVFVDPEYLYVVPSISTRINRDLTTTSASGIATAIGNKVLDFENNQLGNFGQKFRFSKFLSEIDASDVGIVGSSGSVRLERRFRPTTTSTQSYTLEFGQSIYNPHRGHIGAVTSTNFVFNGQTCRFKDDGISKLQIVTSLGSSIIEANAGTVDYLNGTVNIDSFLPTTFTGDEISVSVDPSDDNIVSSRNTILLIRDTFVDVIDDETSLSLATASGIGTTGQSFSVQSSSFSGIVSY